MAEERIGEGRGGEGRGGERRGEGRKEKGEGRGEQCGVVLRDSPPGPRGSGAYCCCWSRDSGAAAEPADRGEDGLMRHGHTHTHTHIHTHTHTHTHTYTHTHTQ